MQLLFSCNCFNSCNYFFSEETIELTPDQIQSKLELQTIKSSLNLSDHTQIIKYEPGPKEEGPIKMEEKFIQQKNEEMSEMLDIEDSIPMAFLVQKPNSNKHIYTEDNGKVDTPVKIESNSTETVPEDNETTVEISEKMDVVNEETEQTDNLKTDNLNQNNKPNDISSGNVDNKIEEVKNLTSSDESCPNEEKTSSKSKSDDNSSNKSDSEKESIDSKWFSILQRQLTIGKYLDDSLNQQTVIASQNLNCDEVHNVAGNRWDISNNLQYFNFSGIDAATTNANVFVSSENIDSSLTLSGLDASLIDSVMNNEVNGSASSETNKDNCQMDNDIEVDAKSDTDKGNEIVGSLQAESSEAPSPLNNQNNNYQGQNIPNYINFNINSLSAYLQCDSPSPLPMTADEQKQLDNVKAFGMPKKLEKNFVPTPLR